VGIVMGYGLEGRVFDCQQGQETFLFSTASRPVLGSMEAPIQWVAGTHFLGVKRPRSEADHLSPSSAEVKNSGVIPSRPVRLHGIVLN
jgi:hypothetical protein